VETKGEEKWKQEKEVQNGMPMFKACHLFLDCAFFFFFSFFVFQLIDRASEFFSC